MKANSEHDQAIIDAYHSLGSAQRVADNLRISVRTVRARLKANGFTLTSRGGDPRSAPDPVSICRSPGQRSQPAVKIDPPERSRHINSSLLRQFQFDSRLGLR